MVFASLTFLFLFLPAVLVAYFTARSRTWRNTLLFAASVFFYAWGEPGYVVLMLASVAANWGLARAMGRWPGRRKTFLWCGVTLNLLGIGVFKYAGFLVSSTNDLIGTGLPVPRLALPIGISFYTFQAISYLVDVYRGTVKPQRSPIFFGTYLTMFSQLIAGPIVRYETIESELMHRQESLTDFAAGVRRFCIGLAKKALIANVMGRIADSVFGSTPAVGAIPAWYGLVAYGFQIYFDFSGYSDMAIGLGRMLGFHFLENFNYPYIARSATEFWRRWHISLSSFFRDYVYIPLGGSRVRAPRLALNLVLVWSLTGLWHGAHWNFVCWGTYYGLLIIGEKLLWGSRLARLPAPLQHVYLLLAVLLGWLMFRVEDFAMMLQWLGTLAGAQGLGHPATLSAMAVLQYYPWFIVAAIGSTPLPRLVVERLERGRYSGWLADGALGCLLIWSAVSLAVGGFNPFIYYRF